jgi:hypothetical protein
VIAAQIYVGKSQPCSGYAASFGYELKDFAEAVQNGEQSGALWPSKRLASAVLGAARTNNQR